MLLKPKTGRICFYSWADGKIRERLFVSLSLFGEGFVLAHYTDTGIPAGLLKSKAFKAQVRAKVVELLTENGRANQVPAKMDMDWSERGLQPEGGWNFDVVFKS